MGMDGINLTLCLVKMVYICLELGRFIFVAFPCVLQAPLMLVHQAQRGTRPFAVKHDGHWKSQELKVLKAEDLQVLCFIETEFARE